MQCQSDLCCHGYELMYARYRRVRDRKPDEAYLERVPVHNHSFSQVDLGRQYYAMFLLHWPSV